MGDGVHQVGLALPRTAMKEQRAETRRARLGQRERGVERDAIRRIDHVPVEGQARIERWPVGGNAHRGRRSGHDRRGRRSLGTRLTRCGGRSRRRCPEQRGLLIDLDRLDRSRGHGTRGGRRIEGLDAGQARDLAGRTGFDDDRADLGQNRLELQVQAVGIVAAHPVGRKGRGERQTDRIGLVALDQLHRLQPLIEQPGACRFAQVRADARPGTGLVRRRSRCLPIRHPRTPLLPTPMMGGRAPIPLGDT